MAADPMLTYSAAGDMVGVRSGTVSRYLAKLRALYGPGLPRGNRGLTDEQRRRGAETAALKTAEVWADIRGQRADRHGHVAEQLLDAIELIVSEIIADPERRKTMTLGDVLVAARATDLLTKSADRLANIDGGPTALPHGADGIPDPGLLSGLEGVGAELGDEDRLTLEAVEMMIVSVQAEQSDQGQAIEVTEAG